MEKIIAEVQSRINALRTQPQVLVAIDGSCTAGKTTLARALEQHYDCNVFHMDDFFLRPEQRTAERLAEVGGNVDYERFAREVLVPLKRGEPVAYRPYDCRTGRLKAPVQVMPKQIAVIEGTYSQHPRFGDAYDLKIFLTVTPEVRTRRIQMRPEFLHRRFFEEWIPMEQAYFCAFSIGENSDIQAMPEENK